MKKFLGIDIGGTNVKFGVVTEKGELLEKIKFPTKEVAANGKFVQNFIKHLREILMHNKDIKDIGIGVPGTISLDRTTLMELANIPSLNGVKFIPQLQKAFPYITFHLENDANAAALGEYYFGETKLAESYLFITLGTGVGGAAIIEKKIFKGGKGNGMEIGHILSGKDTTIEDHLGKRGIVHYANKFARDKKYKTKLSKEELQNPKKISKAALKGDPLCQKVYARLGSKLGECIVAGVRILDVEHIVIGGGVSEIFEYMEPKMWKIINRSLSPYYTENMKITTASLKNEAGIIGAASLCFES